MRRGITKPRTPAHAMPLHSSHRRHCHRGEDADGLWVPRRPDIPCPPRTCYVYLLVHQTENRFKIGKSIHPKGRIAQLPERASLDWARSLQVKLPDATRAGQIESMLHKALAGFRLRRLPGKLIRYSQDDPGTLELVSNAATPIRRVPGGATIARRWIHMCEGYEP